MEIVEGSPAEKAGIQEDDVIIKIDSVRIVSSDEQSLTRILLDKKIGQTVQVTLWRDGEEEVVSVQLEAFGN